MENPRCTVHLCSGCGGAIEHQTTSSEGEHREETRDNIPFSTAQLEDDDSAHVHAPIQTNLTIREMSQGHTTIRSMAFSADGYLVASGAASGKVFVWWIQANAARRGRPGYVRWSDTTHSMDVVALAFSPDGRLVASGSADRSVRLSIPIPGKKLNLLFNDHGAGVSAIAFSADSKYFASGSVDGEVRVWNCMTAEYEAIMYEVGVRSAAFSPTTQILAVGLQDRTVQIWDRGTKQKLQVLAGHPGVVNVLEFSLQGVLASGSGNSIALWDFEVQTATTSVHENSTVISPDGRFSIYWKVVGAYDYSACIRNRNHQPQQCAVSGAILFRWKGAHDGPPRWHGGTEGFALGRANLKNGGSVVIMSSTESFSVCSHLG
jgi:hypothetical protein